MDLAQQDYLRNKIGKSWFWNAADIPRPQKQVVVKTDKIDCRNICKQLANKALKSIVVPEEERESFRSLSPRRARTRSTGAGRWPSTTTRPAPHWRRSGRRSTSSIGPRPRGCGPTRWRPSGPGAGFSTAMSPRATCSSTGRACSAP